jgi:hypothetical protein
MIRVEARAMQKANLPTDGNVRVSHLHEAAVSEDNFNQRLRQSFMMRVKTSSRVGKIPDTLVRTITHIPWWIMPTDRVALFGYTPPAQNRIGFRSGA